MAHNLIAYLRVTRFPKAAYRAPNMPDRPFVTFSQVGFGVAKLVTVPEDLTKTVYVTVNDLRCTVSGPNWRALKPGRVLGYELGSPALST